MKKCDLLIADEVHHFLGEDAELFNKVLSMTDYKYVIGLSATLNEREKRFALTSGLPIIDTINETESVINGYISLSTIYNLGINLTVEDQEKMNRLKDIVNTTPLNKVLFMYVLMTYVLCLISAAGGFSLFIFSVSAVPFSDYYFISKSKSVQIVDTIMVKEK